ncbi:MAG: sigma-70 family RNA polymerase sigma factor [Nannocystales bacterium]
MRRSSVYKENFRFVWNCLRRFGVGGAELEDATHDVFLVVFRRRSELLGASNERAWLFGVIRRVAANYRRGAGRRARRLDAVRQVQPRATRPERDLERTDAARVVGRFLDGLAEPHRDVFVLMELQQMTAREVGELLDLNPNTASARLRSARKAFDRFAAAVRRENGWDGDAVVAQLQCSVTAPSDARKRVGATLAVSLGSKTAMAVGVAAWAKTAAIGLAVGCGGLAALAGIASAMPGSSPASAAQHSPPASAVVDPVPAPTPRPLVAEAEPQRPPTPEVWRKRPATTAASKRPRRSARPRPQAPTHPQEEMQAATDRLGAQTELLARARTALTRGEGQGVLRATAEYRRQFATGPFLAEIELLEIRGHCRTGDTTTARTLGKRFRRAHPDSSHLAVLEKTCAAPVTKTDSAGN